MKLKATSPFLYTLAMLIIVTAYSLYMNQDTLGTLDQRDLSLNNPQQATTSLSNEQISKIQKQYSLLKLTLDQWKQDSLVNNQIVNNQIVNSSTISLVEGNAFLKYLNTRKELRRIEQSRFPHRRPYVKTRSSKIAQVFTINYPVSPSNIKNNIIISSSSNELGFNRDNSSDSDIDIDNTKVIFPLLKSMELDNKAQVLQLSLYKSNQKTIDIKQLKNLSEQQPKNSFKTAKEMNTSSKINLVGYWQTVHSIESKQGKLLYRPRNKSRNCTYTSGPCGHHQLTVQALKDIGCNSRQCLKDRLNYDKSLKLSKKLLALNEKRLKKNGISKLKDYQKYLIHQQGANGIKNILAATEGKKELSNNIQKNMANNSPYSYKQLKKMGSKLAANKFMRHWEKKWTSEKRLIVASQATLLTDSQNYADFIPTFNENELLLAFNVRF